MIDDRCICGLNGFAPGVCVDIDGAFWPGHGYAARASRPEPIQHWNNENSIGDLVLDASRPEPGADLAGLREAVHDAIERVVENEISGVPHWRSGLTDRLTNAALAALPASPEVPLVRQFDDPDRGKPMTEAARRIHASRDGCGGRPHARWFLGRNKCDRLAALAALLVSPADGLDVERLAKAVLSMGWMTEGNHDEARLAATIAANLAREYVEIEWLEKAKAVLKHRFYWNERDLEVFAEEAGKHFAAKTQP